MSSTRHEMVFTLRDEVAPLTSDLNFNEPQGVGQHAYPSKDSHRGSCDQGSQRDLVTLIGFLVIQKRTSFFDNPVQSHHRDDALTHVQTIQKIHVIIPNHHDSFGPNENTNAVLI